MGLKGKRKKAAKKAENQEKNGVSPQIVGKKDVTDVPKATKKVTKTKKNVSKSQKVTEEISPENPSDATAVSAVDAAMNVLKKKAKKSKKLRLKEREAKLLKKKEKETASLKRPLEEVKESYQFQVESADHAETPLQAYEDIADALKEVAYALGSSPEQLRIYDPYFCEGTVKQYLGQCGFPNVYNKNEDFYKCIKEETTPEFDVLVTNPPYSADHVEKLVKFCRKLNKPCFLLMPKFFYMKFYFAAILDTVTFICPPSRYVYEPPKNTMDHAGKVRNKKTKKTAPFVSMWYLMNAGEVLNSNASVKWWNLPNEFRDEGDPNRVKGQKKTKLADGRQLCKICGQVHGNCKHTK